MPINIGREMALPMEQIIGGPMQALIRSQSLAANATADFIQQVGLTTTTNNGVTKSEARTVDFTYNRVNPPVTNANGSVSPATTDSVALSVPLLTIIPVPFIRIQEATIDFECTVSSSTLDTSATSVKVDASASGSFWGCKFSVNVAVSHQSTHSDKVDKSASLKVHVLAVQDVMPGGLKKVLDILETAIASNNTPQPAPSQ